MARLVTKTNHELELLSMIKHLSTLSQLAIREHLLEYTHGLSVSTR